MYLELHCVNKISVKTNKLVSKILLHSSWKAHPIFSLIYFLKETTAVFVSSQLLDELTDFHYIRYERCAIAVGGLIQIHRRGEVTKSSCDGISNALVAFPWRLHVLRLETR
jgi:hypothetical protein